MSPEVKELIKELDEINSQQAKQTELLLSVFDDFNNNRLSEEVRKACPELDKKIVENEKIQYRLDIMKRAASESKNDQLQVASKEPKIVKAPFVEQVKYIEVIDYGDSIIEKLNFTFSCVIEKLYPSLMLNVFVRETVKKPNDKNKTTIFGDYQFDMSTLISRQLLATGIKTTPIEVAKQIAGNLPKISLIDKVDVCNFFINIYLNREHIGLRLASIFDKGTKLPIIKKNKVVVDFSSPNIAKQMHVGHLRSTIIGESISRLLEQFGFEVLRINHIGDWGTQFGMLIAYLQKVFPNYAKEIPPIEDLQAFYKLSKKKFDEDEKFKARAYECVVKLQSFEPEYVKAWQLICDVSRKDFEQIYQRLNIKIAERGESFYQNHMIKLVDELDKLGKLTVDDGRKVWFPTGCSIPMTIVKSDGGFTYDTSDMATIKHRLFDDRADWVLYVVDKGQSEHFQCIFSAAKDLEWFKPKLCRVEHIQFGLVLGEDKKKFKTRSGDTVKLVDLLDEGARRAEATLREKNRDKELTAEEFMAARDAVAYGCIKYADLSHLRTTDYIFSYDKMLDDRGNTAVYLLYAYARIRAIKRTANVSKDQMHVYIKGLAGKPLPLEHEFELKLAKQILKFSDCLLSVLNTMLLNKICDYVYNLATVFSEFYGVCYVIHKQADESTLVDFHRLVLCEITADVMHQCFEILGINAVEKM